MEPIRTDLPAKDAPPNALPVPTVLTVHRVLPDTSMELLAPPPALMELTLMMPAKLANHATLLAVNALDLTPTNALHAKMDSFWMSLLARLDAQPENT